MADVFREVRGRALLQQLLVAPLDGTISFAQPDNMAVVVSQNLHLDMTRPGEEPLGVQLRTAEVRSGLATRRLHGRGGVRRGGDDPHSSSAAAESGLDHDRPAVRLAEGDQFRR